jgi:hypothetical protein
VAETKTTFLASMPPIGSALKISGDGNGARLQLDIPESEMDKAHDLLGMREKELRITIEVVEYGERQDT